MTIAVAVLLIHMLKKAVAIIRDAIKPAGPAGPARIIAAAIRLCNCHRSSALAIKKPPRNRNMRGWA